MTSSAAASRLEEVKFSGIRDVFDKVSQMERDGAEIIHMEIGRPDFDTPEPIKQAAKDALDEGFVHYTSSAGIPELRKALADKFARDNQIDVSPGEIVVTAGASEAIFCCFLAFLDPGDQVLVPDPMYVYYKDWPNLAGAETVPVPLREDNGYQPDPDKVEELVNESTSMLVLNYPHNPTGAVLDRPVVERICEVARKNDLLVVSDEIYERITYGGAEHVSPASLPGMKERTLTVNGFSKAYSMTGWRLGYVAGSEDLITPLLKTRQHTSNCPCSFGQRGALTALQSCEEHMSHMVSEFERRRDLVVEAVQGMPNLELHEPRGAFYAFPSIVGLGKSAPRVAEKLLQEAEVAVVPGDPFGKQGKGHLRIAFSSSYEDLEEGLHRMERTLAEM